MITHKTLEQSNGLVDQVAQTADNAIRSTQHLANSALDSLAGSVQDVRHEAAQIGRAHV